MDEHGRIAGLPKTGVRVHPIAEEPLVIEKPLVEVPSVSEEPLGKPCVEDKEDTISTAPTSRSVTPPVSISPVWPRKMLADAHDHAFMIYGVFSFLPWSQRGDAMCISRNMRSFF